uniref:Disease resistance protein RPM1 n=1 Tax=Aegilops tauschii TaxID=37682 RepID=M8B6Q1_AEGTA
MENQANQSATLAGDNATLNLTVRRCVSQVLFIEVLELQIAITEPSAAFVIVTWQRPLPSPSFRITEVTRRHMENQANQSATLAGDSAVLNLTIRELKIRSCEVGERRMRYDVKVPEPDRDRAKAMKRAGWQAAGNDDTDEQEDGGRRRFADLRLARDRVDGYCEDLLIPFLMDARENHVRRRHNYKVIAVVGMGGKGKTYEAARAYKAPSVVSSFDCKVWICLGQESTKVAAFLRKILAALDNPSDQFDLESAQLQSMEKEELITQLQPNEEEELITNLQSEEMKKLVPNLGRTEEEELIEKLELRLNGKRFLLVIDDVRDGYLWNHIGAAFLKQSCSPGSVILITTRSNYVAHSFSPNLNIDMDTSSDWYLGRAMALTNINWELKPILQKIVSKPLPVGLFLRALYVNPKRTEADLQRFCDNLDNSTTLSSNNARQILKFCNLTSNCKNSLLYMSIFPEDTIFERTRLVRRWAAEGMTAQRGRLSALDEADHCFDLLLAHGFLTPRDMSDTGKVKSCRMDAIILGTVTQIAREDHFVKNNHHPDLAHRLSVHYEGQPQQAEKACWNNCGRQATVEQSNATQEFLESLPSSTHSGILKVFDLEDCNELEDHHVKIICNHAFHLKYLSVRKTGITELPQQLGKLQSLETLDIRETKIKSFAKNSIFLPKLKHLLAGQWTDEELVVNGDVQSKQTFSTVAMPKHIGDMTELQVISHIAVSGDGSELQYVGYLLQLVKLGVVVSGSKASSVLRHLYHATGNLGFLRSLSIQVTKTDEDYENMNRQDASPIYPKYLHKLKISGLKNGLPSWIAKLKSLKFLDIACSAITTINFDNEACPNLKKLTWSSTREKSLSGIERLPRLKNLELTGIFDLQSVKLAIEANMNKPILVTN